MTNAAITNLTPPTPVAGSPSGVAGPGPEAGAGARTRQGGQQPAAAPRDGAPRPQARREAGTPGAHAGKQPRRELGKPGRGTQAAPLGTRRQPAAGKGDSHSAAHALGVVVTDPGFGVVLRTLLAAGNPFIAAHANVKDAASVEGSPGRVYPAVADVAHKVAHKAASKGANKGANKAAHKAASKGANKAAVFVQNSKTGPVVAGKTDGSADAKAAAVGKKPGAGLDVLKQEVKGAVLPRSDAGTVGDKSAAAGRRTGVRVPTDAEGSATGAAQFLKIKTRPDPRSAGRMGTGSAPGIGAGPVKANQADAARVLQASASGVRPSRGAQRAPRFATDQLGEQAEVGSAAPQQFSAAKEVSGALAPEAAERTQPGSPTDQVVQAFRTDAARRGEQVVVRLNPPELGRIRVTLNANGGELRGALEVENARTLADLQREAPALLGRLADAGIRIRQIDITLNNENGGDSSPQTHLQDDEQAAWQGPSREQAGHFVTSGGDAPEEEAVETPLTAQVGDGSINVWM